MPGGHLEKWGATDTASQLPGGNNANTFGINNVGQVVGFAENGVKDSCTTPFQVFRFQPVIWNPDGAIHKVLQPYAGDTVAFAFGINDSGQAVGASGLCSNTTLPPLAPGGPHAVLWESDGTPVDLGNLGGPIAVGTSINERGDVVGGSVSGDGTFHPFLWTRQMGKMQDLGTFQGAVAAVAPCCNTINSRREVVGIWFESNGPAGAFLWRDNQLMELSTLIPQGSPWSGLQAGAINDAGEIAGWGTINGETHAFVAKPVAGESVQERDQAKPQIAAPARRPADSRTLPFGRVMPGRR
jgi:probable HAF family extracellular repeat protein